MLFSTTVVMTCACASDGASPRHAAAGRDGRREGELHVIMSPSGAVRANECCIVHLNVHTWENESKDIQKCKKGNRLGTPARHKSRRRFIASGVTVLTGPNIALNKRAAIRARHFNEARPPRPLAPQPRGLAKSPPSDRSIETTARSIHTITVLNVYFFRHIL